MRITLSSVLSSIVLAAVGCTHGGPSDPAGGDGLGGKVDEWAPEGGATIVFGDDWSETVTGTLRGGGPLRIRYDADRLPDCRGEMGGRPQWGISAYASVDGADASFVMLAPSADGLLEGTLEELPAGDDLAMWFTVTNRWGCHAYDSNFGDDYHFEIGSAPAGGAATVTFADDWSMVASGPIHAGDVLTVSYDLDRLSTCRGTMYGNPAWNIAGYYAVDGGEAESFEVTRVVGDDRVSVPAEIEVPAGREIAFWFEITNRWGCHEFDSNFGANWTLPIEAD